MKKKFITLREYREIMEPGERLSYSDKFPSNVITLPSRKGVFIAWHGPEALLVNGSTGTAYTCRIDVKDPKPLNIDVYSLRPTKDKDIIEIVLIPHQDYHWSDDVPYLMKESVPDWIKERIEKIKNKNK